MNLILTSNNPLFNTNCSTTPSTSNGENSINTLNSPGWREIKEKKFGKADFIMNNMPNMRTINMIISSTAKFFNMRRLFFLLQILALPCLFSFTRPATKASNEQLDAGAITIFTAQTNSEPVVISWSEVSGVEYYSVEITENGVTVQQLNVSGTTKTLTGLVSGHSYRCTVVGMAKGTQVTDYIIGIDILP